MTQMIAPAGAALALSTTAAARGRGDDGDREDEMDRRSSKKPRVRALPLLLLGVLLLVACDDGSGPGQGVSLETFAQVNIAPGLRDVRLIAGTVPLGESEPYVIRITDVGQADLEITGITLTYAAPPGVEEEAPAFELVLPSSVDLAAGPATLRPSGSVGDAPDELALSVLFRHNDRVPRTARLLIESNSRDDAALSIVFTTEEGAPVVAVTPEELDFGSVAEGEAPSLTLTMVNSGAADLYFTGFQLFGDPGYTFVDPTRGESWPLSSETQDGVLFESPHVIGPNRSVAFEVRFTPGTDRLQEARLILVTNDERAGDGLVVRLVANRVTPLAVIEPEAVDFDRVPIGATLPRFVRVYSRGSAALEVTGLSLLDGTSFDFTLDTSLIAGFEDGRLPTEHDSIIVPVNDFVELAVLFTPNMEVRNGQGELVADQGTLRVETNAYVSPVDVPLTGYGLISDCPIAAPRVVEGEEVTPQTTLHLRGDESLSSCGPIDRYQWTATQPSGAAASFLPSPTFGNPTFPADVAGTYEFCLTVWDTCGLAACEPACTEVVVVPDQALHIELLWNTPTDPDPFDDGPLTGADLDLHFAHPFALIGGEDLDGDGAPDGWFNSTYDCFWANPQPDWGSFDPTAADDPGLDRDDTDGAGPENVNLDEPEDLTTIPPELYERLGGAPAAFRVGVHYWNDNGFGPSFATLRVYVHGVLVYERSDVRLVHHDMWHALTVGWPSGAVDEIRTTDGELKITPEYEHPAFVAP